MVAFEDPESQGLQQEGLGPILQTHGAAFEDTALQPGSTTIRLGGIGEVGTRQRWRYPSESSDGRWSLGPAQHPSRAEYILQRPNAAGTKRCWDNGTSRDVPEEPS